MFAKRGAAKTQARRDEEWRLLVRSVTDPGAVPSEAEEALFRAHLGEPGERPRRRRLRWMSRAPEEVDGVPLDSERR
ncbi:MAG: hypothetical protein JWN81_1402 [Solirubrobacterales bacterium]|jgi:hypothetical protein|nr:hypothetical protein [Solirubrobacterales bacterium]